MKIKEILANIKSDLLTEDVQKQIETIFEASVNEAVQSKVEELEENFEIYKAEEIENLTEKTKEYMDTYLVGEMSNYIKFATEEFMSENKMAIESGIKAEMFDKLVVGMKKVLSENYIEVNEDESIKNMENEFNKSKEEYNGVVKENMQLKEEVNLLKCGAIFEKLAEGLSIGQKERFGKLVSDFDTDDEKVFEEKATIVKENMITEDDDDNDSSDEGEGEGENLDENFIPNGESKSVLSGF